MKYLSPITYRRSNTQSDKKKEKTCANVYFQINCSFKNTSLDEQAALALLCLLSCRFVKIKSKTKVLQLTHIGLLRSPFQKERTALRFTTRSLPKQEFALTN